MAKTAAAVEPLSRPDITRRLAELMVNCSQYDKDMVIAFVNLVCDRYDEALAEQGAHIDALGSPADTNRLEIINGLQAAGIVTYPYYPDCIEVPVGDKILIFGQANGHWGFDFSTHTGRYLETGTWDVPQTLDRDATTPEVVAWITNVYRAAKS